MGELREGIAINVSSKVVRNNTTLWSFQVDGDKAWYRTGYNKPVRPSGEVLQDGDKVKFVFSKDQYGNQVDMDKFKVVAGKGAPPKKAFSGGAKGGGAGKENWDARAKYWDDKEKKDEQVIGPMFDYRSALHAAIDVVAVALKAEAVNLGTKKAARLEILQEMIHTVQQDLYEDFRRKHAELAAGDVKEEEKTNPDEEDTDDEDDSKDDDGWADDDDAGDGWDE